MVDRHGLWEGRQPRISGYTFKRLQPYRKKDWLGTFGF